jgi:hypothetical protein
MLAHEVFIGRDVFSLFGFLFGAAVLGAVFFCCSASAEKGSARPEVTMEAVPTRKVRRGVFILGPLRMV